MASWLSASDQSHVHVNTEGHLDDDVKLLSAHEARQRLKTIDRQLGRA